MNQKDSNVSIINKTKGKLPSLSFATYIQIKDAILGKKYDLSVAFVSITESRKLNRTMRGKDKPTNILSFELSKNSGELVINLSAVKKDAPKFGQKTIPFFKFLLIHGMLHLKGMQHGSTMESMEVKFKKKFGI
jgi:probable rRNA maturation factor